MNEDPQALGQRLKAERERRGFSTQKIANGMHLDEWVIDALEAGDYRRIGPEVYAKGHLKQYANLLGVTAAAPAADAAPASPSAAIRHPPPIVRLDAPKDAHAAWPRIGAVAAVAILAGGVFWWRQSTHGISAPAPAALPPPQVLASADSPTETPAEPPAETPADADASAGNAVPATEEPADAAHATAVPAPRAAAMPAMMTRPALAPAAPAAPPGAGSDLTPGVGKARLRLSFSADSWVDIRDYSGKRLFEGNGRANSVKTVAGVAPFRVFLRSASGVQLQLNDRAVAIGRQFMSGDEARFEAGADGVLRRQPPASPGNGPQTAAVSPHG